jgi:hypothetical protein
MRTFRPFPILRVLALLPCLAWPLTKPAGRGHRSHPPSPRACAEPATVLPEKSALPVDPFREFLDESGRAQDSIHFRRGELALDRDEFDMALGYHLAAALPDEGLFRADLLAQRSRIFARIWPIADRARPAGPGPGDPAAIGPEPDPPKPALDWSVGTGHSRQNERSGPQSLFGNSASWEKRREWKYNATVRQSLPFSIGKQNLGLSLSGEANRSASKGPSDYAGSLDLTAADGILENASLSLSTGLAVSHAFGSYRFHGLTASKSWYSESAHAGFEAGLGRQWDGGWRRFGDNAWATVSRDFQAIGGGNANATCALMANWMKTRAERYPVPVWFVDDAVPGRPAYSLAPGSGDTVGLEDLDSALSEDPRTRVVSLGTDAPQTFFSIAPALNYGFSFTGWQARVGANYALDIYPEYAWDRLTWPDGLDPDAGERVGLVEKRSDGRTYASVLVNEDGKFREYTGSVPLERHEGRRMDSRAGLDLALGKTLPQGYFLGLQSSVAVQWSSLPVTAPADFRPWQWGLSLTMSGSRLF